MPENFPRAFEKFVNKYRDRFGQKRMGDDTAAMFFDKLCFYEGKQFETVTDGLFGSNEYAFGWKRIVERFTILFPGEANQQMLESTWKLDYANNPKKEITRALGHLNTCIPDLVKANLKGWRVDFFKRHIEICGIEESTKIAQDLQFQFPEFKDWIYKNYRKKAV